MKTSNPFNEEESDESKQGQFCGFSALVKWDKFGFFVELEKCSGNEMHQYHPQIMDASVIPFPTRL